MKIIIGEKTYREMKNLAFDVVADISGAEIPINQFSADIRTDDDIGVGINACLYDETDRLWAKYWLVSAQRQNADFVQIVARSTLLLLERIRLPAVMYSGYAVDDALADLFQSVTSVYPGVSIYSIDGSYQNTTISGFAPEQSAKERLQWICFVIGAYIRTAFTDKVEILPADMREEMVPEDKTFRKPAVQYNNNVTAVKVTAYTYAQGTPSATDKWVESGGVYYIQTQREYTLTNPDIPVTETDNVVSFEKLTLINEDNVSAILTRVSTYYFKNIEVQAELVNNAEYEPGKRYMLSTGDILVSGFMKSASFAFGHQAKSGVHLLQTDGIESASLLIKYYFGATLLKRNRYLFPTGYVFRIENPHIDKTIGVHRYIFYPDADYAEGVVAEGGVTDQESCSMAIDACDGIVYLISVDSCEERGEVVSIE